MVYLQATQKCSLRGSIMFSKVVQLILLTFIYSASANADYAVIVNIEAGLTEITTTELRKIYLKKIPVLPNGKSAVIVGLASGDAREQFNKEILRKSESSLNSYWSRLMFSGRAKPPQLFQSDNDVLEFIRRNPNSIGFISSNADLGEKITQLNVK